MSAGKTSLPSEFKELGRYASAAIKQTAGPRKLLLQQLTEALRTGGVKAKIPLIQQSVASANAATSQALRQTSEELAMKNVGGTFANRILAGTRLAGERATSAIPTTVAENLIKQTTPFLSATQSLGFGGLAQVGQASFASDAFNAQQFKALMEDIKDSLMGSGQMAAGCLHPHTMIETPDGAVHVEDLSPGDTVWSQDRNGKRVKATVDATARIDVGPDWQMLKIEAPGGAVYVSPTHPLPDGTPLAKRILGVRYTSGSLNTIVTCDISVDGPTGIYFAKGLPLGSTLDTRHQRAA